jgi:hypothetical protein
MAAFYQAMHEESAFPHTEHDVTGLSYLRANGLDGEKIAGPQRWEHADACGAQFQCPPGLQSFGRQTASAFVTGFEIHAVRGFPSVRSAESSNQQGIQPT